MRRLLSRPAAMRDVHYDNSIAKLSQELEAADVLEEQDIPKEVIRINSIVTIATAQNNNKSFRLVLPEESDISKNLLSILSPMGLALYGYAEGDHVIWEFPSGVNKITIMKVGQPGQDEAILNA